MKTFNLLRFHILFIFLSTFATSINAKTIYYVTATGTGDGSTWAKAANNIQTMIDKAVSGDEVWVAKGTYYPTTETIARDARSRTFSVKNGVNLYGGFAGSESLVSQRALADLNIDGKIDSCELVSKTILSGDIDGVPDVWTKTINSDDTWKWSIIGNSGNSYTVVYCLDNNIVDGFSVTNGNADISTYQIGGGVFATSTSSIKNCTVTNCSALYRGGGIYSSSVTNCIVANCSSSNSGGGIYSDQISNSSIKNCNVSNCYASTSGGGIFTFINSNNDKSIFSNVTNCTVSNCSASIGGGIYSSARYRSYSSVTNCVVSNCTASSNGGGIYSSSYSTDFNIKSSSNVENCTLSNCLASNGGGIYASTSDFSKSSIYNCKISNCSASTTGGGISCSPSSIVKSSKFINCTVVNCYAKNNGGGIYSSSSSVLNCVVSNCAASSAGGIDGKFINNCAICGNSNQSSITGSYNANNISSDILIQFVNPTSFVGVAITDAQKTELMLANWHLRESSSCINAGKTIDVDGASLTLPKTDLENNPRELYGTIDIGAYEFIMPTIPMPVMENFNNWTDFDKSNLFYRSAKLNTLNDNKWTIVNQKADFSWQTNLTSTYSQPIFTYQIDGTKSSKVYLRYDLFFQAYAGTISPLGTEKLNVEFSTDLVTWSNIANYSNANGTIANQAYKHDISTLAAGKTFFIRFNANGVNSNRIEKWEIDNVIIDANGLSAVNNVQEEKYKYALNNGVLIISNLENGAGIQLFDINGSLLKTLKSESNTAHLALPVKGAYLIKVSSVSGVENKKMVW